MDIAKILDNPFQNMSSEKKQKLFKVMKIVNFVVAGLFALWALIGFVTQIVNSFNFFSFFSFVAGLVTVGAYVMLALSVFMRKKLFALIGFGCLCFSQFVYGIISFTYVPSLGYSDMTGFFADLLGSAQYIFMFAAFGLFAFGVLVALNFIKPFGKLQSIVKKLWFVPVVCFVVYYIFDFFIKLFSIIDGSFFFATAVSIVSTFVLMVASLYVAFVSIDPYGIGAEEAEVNGNTFEKISAAATSTQENDSIYMNLAPHILLLIFTFGVWQYMWIFKTTRRLNDRVKDGEQSPVAQLLLCMFVPFYSIFWVNRSAHRIDTLARERGVNFFSIGILCLLLALFVGFLAPAIIMQIKMNAIAKNSSEVSQEPVETEEEAVVS